LGHAAGQEARATAETLGTGEFVLGLDLTEFVLYMFYSDLSWPAGVRATQVTPQISKDEAPAPFSAGHSQDLNWVARTPASHDNGGGARNGDVRMHRGPPNHHILILRRAAAKKTRNNHPNIFIIFQILSRSRSKFPNDFNGTRQSALYRPQAVRKKQCAPKNTTPFI
jgi:hypothetical protein